MKQVVIGLGRMGTKLLRRLGEGDFADNVLSAQFGGHEEKAPETKRVA
jgi:hypothetical protein